MKANGITIVGLGPGDPMLMTREVWSILQTAHEIYLRTSYHAAVDNFPDNLQVHSFDDLYETCETFEDVYREIVSQILILGNRPEGVIYGVPGHPFVAEYTGPEIYRQAREAGIPVRVCDGISFLEVVFSALGIDPYPHTALVDALALVTGHHPPFPPDTPALIAQIYDSYIAAEVKLSLMNIYPDEHPVSMVHAAGTSETLIEAIPLFEIDRSPHIGISTALYLPPVGIGTSFESLQEIAAHLRAPEGCPWDQEQTLQTLQPSLLEETFEVLEAIDKGQPDKIQEELGDLLLVVAMLMQITSEQGDFTSAEVIRAITSKLIHRHPHVFGDMQVDGSQAVLQNWEELKAQERAANGEPERDLLAGVSIALPALAQAQEYQSRTARVGFDWPNIAGVLEKVAEELVELQNSKDDHTRVAELGDLLFALVNLSRWYEVDAESALRAANTRFRERFAFIEAAARSQGRKVAEMSLSELDVLWDQAKAMLGTKSGA